MLSRFAAGSFLVLLSTLMWVGCSPDQLSEVALPIPDDAEIRNDDANSTSTVLPKLESSDLSPATHEFNMPTTDAAPEVVCQQFVELLNLELPNYFELLMTPAALNVANRNNFHLPPIASANSPFTVEPPVFSSIRQKICFVSCQFEAMSPQDDQQNITFMMRKNKSGWRIAGMMVETEESEFGNLLSFENSTDVKQIKQSLEVSVDLESQ